MRIKSVHNIIRASVLLVFILFCALIAQSQEEIKQEVQKTIDYNVFYRFPFSSGVEYQSLTPFNDYGMDFTIYDFSAVLRLPLPFFPSLQPLAQGGMIQFVSQDRLNPEKWNHVHWYGALGIGYSYRFSKTFEIGAELSGGISAAIFPNLDSNGPRSTINLLASLGGRASLNPSYNISVDINPSIKYL